MNFPSENGDFNRRMCVYPDYALNFDYMSVLPDDYISDTHMPRYSEDEMTDW